MKNIGLFFGSRSVEHEISIITAHQVLNAIDKNKYNVIPVYISKNGSWYVGNALNNLENFKDLEKIQKKAHIVKSISKKENKLILNVGFKKYPIDLCFLTFHGSNGEDGSFQGLCEFFNIPYTGCGLYSSTFSMDKVITKIILKEKNIPIIDFAYTTKKEYNSSFLDLCESKFGYPMIVKPARLGSSIGVKKVEDRIQLKEALDVVFELDEKVLVEKWIKSKELNCAVMGYKSLIVSEVEEIKKEKDFFDYNEKYIQKGKKFSNHIIPANINSETKELVQKLAKDAFNALECYGNIRIDFLIDENNNVYVNEINSIPGALAYYLWQNSGFTFSQVIDNMISIAFDIFNDKNKKIYSINTNVLDIKVEK